MDNFQDDERDDKKHRQNPAATFQRVLLVLIEPTVLLPIIIIAVVVTMLVLHNSNNTILDEHAFVAREFEDVQVGAEQAGVQVQKGADFFQNLAHRNHTQAKAIHQNKVHTPAKKKNKAYPCDDYDDCQSCVSNHCGWCKADGWCVQDMPGICKAQDDHVGKASGMMQCPEQKPVKSHEDEVKDLADDGLISGHPKDEE